MPGLETAIDEAGDVEFRLFLLFLPVVVICSPSSKWLRLRLVSVCPLRGVFDLGVSPLLVSFVVFSLAFLLSFRFAVTH